jgi:putative ABC transport system permease protein
MQIAKLVVKNGMRHRLRSLLTVIGLAVAVVAFGLLQTIVSAWYSGVKASAPNRLITRSAVSLTFFLPLSYKTQIEKVPGITLVTEGLWFGGVYIDEKNFFPQIAVNADSFFDMYPEFVLTPDQREVFVKERNSAVVGRKLAERYGWKLGDTVRIRGTIFPGDWDFVVRGIYNGRDETVDETQFLFHWQYVDEMMRETSPSRVGWVGWYWLRIADPSQSAQIAQRVDELFKNSTAESITETEREFQLGFVSMGEAIIVALKMISIVIIGIILLVLGNTMAMTARERISEYAVMKTLGFRPVHLIALIAGESIAIAVAGGLLGIAFTMPIARAFANYVDANLGSFFPVFELEPKTIVQAFLAVLGVGVLAAVFPTLKALRLKIAEGLRYIG